MGMFDGNELRFVIRCSGSVIPKGMIWAVPSAVFATLLHMLLEGLGVDRNFVQQDSQIWTTFYYVLGVLLVFRTNQAYARYWEGATLLQQVRGEWINAVSSLCAFCSKDAKKKAEVEKFQQLLVRLMSMLYCMAIQKIALIPPDKFETISTAGVDPESLAFLTHVEEQCEVLVHWMQRHIIDGLNNEVVIVPAPILSRVFQELSRGLVNAQNVRKIAEVPFPFPYTQMSIVMLLSSTLLTPVLAAITSSTSWEAAFLSFMPVLTFWCLNYMAAEIEQPFGEDANDLPLPEMVMQMNNSLKRLIDPQTQNLPRFDYIPEQHASCPTQNWTEHYNQDFKDVLSSTTLASSAGDRRYAADFAKRRRASRPKVPGLQQNRVSQMSYLSSRRSSGGSSVTGALAQSPAPPAVFQQPPAPPSGPAEVLQMPTAADQAYTSARERRVADSGAAAGAARPRTFADGGRIFTDTGRCPPPSTHQPPPPPGQPLDTHIENYERLTATWDQECSAQVSKNSAADPEQPPGWISIAEELQRLRLSAEPVQLQ